MFEPLADGVRPVPEGSAAPVARRTDGTVTPEGARELAKRRWEAERLPDFGDSAAPWLPPCEELAPFDGARKELLRQRRDELATMTGGLDSGAGAVLRLWAYLHAAAEFWASQFFSTGDPAAFEAMTRACKAASAEEAKARDAAAWSAEHRPRRPADVPWLISTPAPAPKPPAEHAHGPAGAVSPATPATAPTDQDEPTTGRLAPSDEEPQS
jgi:hypothetical protein